jgi:hypothetical protein
MAVSRGLEARVIDLMVRKPPVGVKATVTRYAGAREGPGLVEC